MPQNDFIDLHKKRYGQRLDTEERLRKKEARSVHEVSAKAQ
jgi:ribosome biogenesis protein NSA2